MRLPIRMLLISLTLALSAGCDQPAATAQTAAALWIDAYNAGEVDKIVALYTEDAVVMPTNVPALIGRTAIRDFLTQDIDAAGTGADALVAARPD